MERVRAYQAKRDRLLQYAAPMEATAAPAEEASGPAPVPTPSQPPVPTPVAAAAATVQPEVLPQSQPQQPQQQQQGGSQRHARESELIRFSVEVENSLLREEVLRHRLQHARLIAEADMMRSFRPVAHGVNAAALATPAMQPVPVVATPAPFPTQHQPPQLPQTARQTQLQQQSVMETPQHPVPSLLQAPPPSAATMADITGSALPRARIGAPGITTSGQHAAEAARAGAALHSVSRAVPIVHDDATRTEHAERRAVAAEAALEQARATLASAAANAVALADRAATECGRASGGSAFRDGMIGATSESVPTHAHAGAALEAALLSIEESLGLMGGVRKAQAGSTKEVEDQLRAEAADAHTRLGRAVERDSAEEEATEVAQEDAQAQRRELRLAMEKLREMYEAENRRLGAEIEDLKKRVSHAEGESDAARRELTTVSAEAGRRAEERVRLQEALRDESARRGRSERELRTQLAAAKAELAAAKVTQRVLGRQVGNAEGDSAVDAAMASGAGASAAAAGAALRGGEPSSSAAPAIAGAATPRRVGSLMEQVDRILRERRAQRSAAAA